MKKVIVLGTPNRLEKTLVIKSATSETNRKEGTQFGYWYTNKEVKNMYIDDTICIFKLKLKKK